MIKPPSHEKTILDKHVGQLRFDIKRGFLQFIVLSLINEKPQYVYEIKNEVFEVTGGCFDIDRNNLYKKLRALEREGILRSVEKPSARGANRKYYALTPLGKKLLNNISGLMIPVIESFFVNIPKM